jgi:ABC-type multidrug transport system fused ATPase/permease subunit
MDHLTKQQQSFCDNTGLGGILLALTCLFQHLYLMIPGWFAITMIVVYLFATISFVFLVRKSTAAPVLLLISVILIFLQEVVMILGMAYSLVLLLLLVYSIVIVMLVFTSSTGLQKNLRLRAAAKREEQEEWSGKI